MEIPGFKLLSGGVPQEQMKPPSPSKSLLSNKGKEGLRDLGRTGARALENLAGIPGDLASLVLGAGNYATRGSIPTYAQVQEKLPVSLPTTSQVREFGKNLTGGILEPQSSGEQLWDDVVSGFTNLIAPIPGTGKLTAAKTALKGVQAVAGSLAGKAAENMGFGQLGQGVANTITTLLTGIAGTKFGLKNQMQNAFDNAEKLSEGKSIGSNITEKLNHNIGKIKQDANAYKGVAKDFAESRIKDIQGWLPVKGSSLSLPRAMQGIKDLNSFYDTASKAERSWLHKISKPLREALEEYGKAGGAPEWYKDYSQANDLYKGYNTASSVGKFMNDHVNLNTLKNPIVHGVLLASHSYHQLPKALLGLGTAFSAKEAVKIVDFMAHSKVGAQAYKNMIVSSMNHNVHEFNKNVRKFDNALTKYGVAPEGFTKVS